MTTRILLIDPDAKLREIYTQYLFNNGYDVIDCGSAEGAIKILDKQRTVDLIVLELQLANHNGLEFMYELRSYPEWQKIPVVLHTLVPPNSFEGYGKTMVSKLGIIDYAYKPATTLARLLAVIQNAVAITV